MGVKSGFLLQGKNHKLQVFGKKNRKMFWPTRDEVTDQFRILHNEELCKPDSSVVWRWAMGWMIGDSSPGRGWEFFFLTTVTRLALGPTPLPIQRVSGTLSLGVKRPRRVADHSPLSSAEVKNAWIYTSTPQYAFMAWCSVNKKRSLGTNLPFTYTFTIMRNDLHKSASIVGAGIVQSV
jgi:hypothetical protein